MGWDGLVVMVVVEEEEVEEEVEEVCLVRWLLARGGWVDGWVDGWMALVQ